jgi:hypothetical protein
MTEDDMLTDVIWGLALGVAGFALARLLERCKPATKRNIVLILWSFDLLALVYVVVR